MGQTKYCLLFYKLTDAYFPPAAQYAMKFSLVAQVMSSTV